MQTPKEVYQALKAEGYRVDYHRVPLTDGVAPGEAAFDMFFEHLKDARAEDPLVFNCQMGSGRTTTGMVMGCLIRMHTTGQCAGWHACTVTVTRYVGERIWWRSAQLLWCLLLLLGTDLPVGPCRQWAIDRAPGGAARGVLPSEHNVRGLCCRGVR